MADPTPEACPWHVHDALGGPGHARARIGRVDGVPQPGAVRGQVLNGAGLNGAVVRGDHGGQIVRAQGLDRGGGNLPGGDGRLFQGNRPIHQDDDEPSFLLACLIGDDVGGDVGGPDGFGRTRPRQLDRREGTNRRLDAVVENREVRGGQPTHGLALVIEDGHVELQQLDAGAELRGFALSLREERGRQHDGAAREAERAAEYAHPDYFLGASESIGPWRNRTAVTAPLASFWNSSVASTTL